MFNVYENAAECILIYISFFGCKRSKELLQLYYQSRDGDDDVYFSAGKYCYIEKMCYFKDKLGNSYKFRQARKFIAMFLYLLYFEMMS